MKLISSKNIIIAFWALFVISSGCAKNHRVLINPSIPIHDSTIGNQLPVAVRVVDSRSSNVISKWQGEFKVRKFTVISQGDLKDIFTTRTRQALTKLGFSPKNFNLKSERSLLIEILSIKSHYQEDPPKINIRVKANIKATCKNQGKWLSKNFTSKKNRSDISPASFPNESLLNDSLSEIMGKIFTNPSLIACLTAEQPAPAPQITR
ncbi:MAG: hypothetical protein H8E42_01560 [Nitrospinae bacterium]|nr:hypothetical protein [Nitrospinota bacterium]MBL7019377.1 hypothetical protein [Nitrospinaceae bacterium]